MTEAEWLACEDPQKMLEFLRGKASERKFRLFACACCRSILDRLPDPRSRHAIDVVEDFIEGMTSTNELEAARREAEVAQFELLGRDQTGAVAVWATTLVLEWTPNRWPSIGSVVVHTQLAAAHRAELKGKNRKERKRYRSIGYERMAKALCAIIHDLSGNPFRPVTVDPTWQTATVTGLAQAIYDERAFDRLPILADALEDASCTNADILGHCRGSGKHVRGCWVVDLVLGKE